MKWSIGMTWWHSICEFHGSQIGVPSGASRSFGLSATTAPIVGIGVGVGMVNPPKPQSIGGYIALVSMVLTTAGALALTLLSAPLHRRLPTEGSGRPYDHLAYTIVGDCRDDTGRSLLVMGADVRLADPPDAVLVATLGS